MTKTITGNLCEDEFENLFNSYKNRIYNFVLAITHSHYIAEEITQEIFIKLWLCRDALTGIENLDAYVFSMVRNKSIDYLRKAISNEKIMRSLYASQETGVNNVEERSSLAEYNKLLMEAIGRLPQQRRLVYELSRNEGLNRQQIAAELHISPHTVKNHLLKAIAAIRKHITDSNIISVFLFFFSMQ